MRRLREARLASCRTGAGHQFGRLGLPAIRICAGQSFLPRPDCRIYNLSFDWLGEVLMERCIKACCQFCAWYPWNILIIDLYSLSATLATHSRSLNHRHTIHRPFCGVNFGGCLRVATAGGQLGQNRQRPNALFRGLVNCVTQCWSERRDRRLTRARGRFRALHEVGLD